MVIVSRDEFEHLKNIPGIWNKYNGNIGIEEKESAGIKINNQGDLLLPKFFLDLNWDILYSEEIGQKIVLRQKEFIDYEKSYNLHSHNMNKMTVHAEPRKEQLPVFEEYSKRIQETGNFNGIIVAKPGVGKTYMSIKLASLIKQKTICIVPNDILEGQWVESILEFSNLERDDIGIIQGSDINKLTKNSVYDKDIVVCKVQSLLSQLKTHDLYYLYNLYSIYGAVFFDECHTSGSAESYSKTAALFKTKNIIGLSATPFTKGINNFLMHNSMGDIAVELDHQNLIPNIHLHRACISLEQNEINKLQWGKNDYIQFLAMHNSFLENKIEYLQFIVDWAIYRNQSGHDVAILFSTNKIVYKVANMLKQQGYDPGVIVGKTKKKVPKQVRYLNQLEYQKYLNNFKLYFPKRKLKEYKIRKVENISGYMITKPFEKDILKINESIEDKIVITESIAEEMSEREIMNSKNIVVSNFKLLTAGYSKESLSTVLIGTPLIGKVPSIQVTGRVTRKYKNKPQDVHAHFLFTDIYLKYFPNMAHVLVNNLKVAYPTANFTWDNFNFDEENE